MRWETKYGIDVYACFGEATCNVEVARNDNDDIFLISLHQHNLKWTRLWKVYERWWLKNGNALQLSLRHMQNLVSN